MMGRNLVDVETPCVFLGDHVHGLIWHVVVVLLHMNSALDISLRLRRDLK